MICVPVPKQGETAEHVRIWPNINKWPNMNIVVWPANNAISVPQLNGFTQEEFAEYEAGLQKAREILGWSAPASEVDAQKVIPLNGIGAARKQSKKL